MAGHAPIFEILAPASTAKCATCRIASRPTGLIFSGMRLTSVAGILAVALVGAAEPPPIRRIVDERPALQLRSVAQFNHKEIPECSALWASPSMPGVFWTLSDSGNKPQVVAIRADGSFVRTERGPWQGVTLKGLVNTDWEAITGDETTMVIADVGNNISKRRELNLYFLPEPRPGVTEVADFRKVSFAWPDQGAFPDPNLEHDCEAAFMLRGKLYLLTKHRRDTLTDLWRIDVPVGGNRAVPVKLCRFDALGMVTDAALSPDRRRLAVLTYRMVWVFDLPAGGEDFFTGKAMAAPISPPLLSWQVEGCSWVDGQTLLLGSEQGDLFKVSLTDLGEVR